METQYRGYTIKKRGDTDFEVCSASGYRVCLCGSAWGAICYIDELLSP